MFTDVSEVFLCELMCSVTLLERDRGNSEESFPGVEFSTETLLINLSIK
jgi:hypothetical protein